MTCSHRDAIALARLSEDEKAGAVCAACVDSGDEWLHLRQCRTCGAVSCCDDSPNRHARKHWETAGHPIVTSAEPREIWTWCFADAEMLPRGS